MILFKDIDFNVFYNINRDVYKESNKKYEALIKFHNIWKSFSFKYKIQLIYLIPINLIVVIYKYFIYYQAKKHKLFLQNEFSKFFADNVKRIRTSYIISDPTYYNKYISFTGPNEHKQFFIEAGKEQVLNKLFEEVKKYVDIKVENRELEGMYIITAEINVIDKKQ